MTMMEEIIIMTEGDFVNVKWCGACKDFHPIEEFAKDRTRKLGLSVYCKKTYREKMKKYAKKQSSEVA